MIDVLNEDLIDLAAACKLPPFRNQRTGKAAHISSLYRYAMAGAKASDGQRIRLETVKAPAGLVTSRQAVERFIRQLTDPDADVTAPTDRDRIRQIMGVRHETGILRVGDDWPGVFIRGDTAAILAQQLAEVTGEPAPDADHDSLEGLVLLLRSASKSGTPSQLSVRSVDARH